MNYTTDCTEISQMDSLPENPVVSVLMLTYNHERFIAQAIEGIAKQVTDFPIELIIGEDGSSDSTLKIVLDYQKKHPNLIRVLYPEKNMGPKKNVIRSLARCRGQFIALCEGDDYWVDIEKLQKQVNFLNSNPSFVVCYHNAAIVDEDGNITKASKLSEIHKRDFTNDELIMGTFILTLTMCFRNVVRTLPEEYIEVLNGDTFLTSLLGNYGTGHYMSEVEPAMYRQHSGGIWSSIGDRKKIEKRIGTYYWLSLYYHRINDKKNARKMFIRAMDEINNALNTDNLTLIRYLLRRIKNNLLQKIK